MKAYVYRIIAIILIGMIGIVATVTTCAQDNEPVYSLEWSPDGKTIAISGGASKCDSNDLSNFPIRLFDVASGKVTKRLYGHICPTISLDWSHDGSKLVSVSSSIDDGAHIWNVAEERIMMSTVPELDYLTSVVWQPNGNLIASTLANGTTLLWDVTTGIPQLVSDIYGTAVDWSPDGTKLVIASVYSSEIDIIDAATLEELAELHGHQDGVGIVRWSFDGNKIASSSWDDTVKIWDAITGTLLLTLQGHADNISGIDWNPDNTSLASSSTNGNIYFWDTQTGQSLSSFQANIDIHSIAWSPDGSQLAYGGDNGNVMIVPAPTSPAPTVTPIANAPADQSVLAVAWSPDGTKIAGGGADGTILIWNESGQLLLKINGHEGRTRCVDWSPDSTKIVSGGDDKLIRIWDAETGQLLATIAGHEDVIQSVDWSPDAKQIVSTSFYDQYALRTWSASSYQPLVHSDYLELFDARWSPDGNQIVVANSNGFVSIVSTDLTTSHTFEDSEPALTVAWRLSSNEFASGYTDGRIVIWDVVSETQKATFTGHTDRVDDVAFSPDGLYLASASFDGTLRIWDMATGQTIVTYQRPAIFTTSISWSLDGSQLAYGGDNGTVVIVPVPTAPAPTITPTA